MWEMLMMQRGKRTIKSKDDGFLKKLQWEKFLYVRKLDILFGTEVINYLTSKKPIQSHRSVSMSRFSWHYRNSSQLLEPIRFQDHFWSSTFLKKKSNWNSVSIVLRSNNFSLHRKFSNSVVNTLSKIGKAKFECFAVGSNKVWIGLKMLNVANTAIKSHFKYTDLNK